MGKPATRGSTALPFALIVSTPQSIFQRRHASHSSNPGKQLQEESFMVKLPCILNATSVALLSLACLNSPAYSQQMLTGSVTSTAATAATAADTTGFAGGDTADGSGQDPNALGQTTSGIVGPVGDPGDTASDGYLFSIPNFEGDTREQDLYYYMHPYAYAPWDTYRQLLYSYAANARQQMSQGWPPPPYSVYNYAGSIATGTGMPINPPAGANAAPAAEGSGVTVNPNGGGITGAPSTAGENSGLGGTAITNVSGTLVQPPTVVPPAATIEPLGATGATPGLAP